MTNLIHSVETLAQGLLPPAGTYLRAKEAASYLQICWGTLANWRVKGCGPRFSKIGRTVVYQVSDLDAFVEQGLVRSTSEASAASAKRKG